MTRRTFTGKGGETWEWEETPEVLKALTQLEKSTKQTQHKLANLKLKRPYERQTNNS